MWSWEWRSDTAGLTRPSERKSKGTAAVLGRAKVPASAPTMVTKTDQKEYGVPMVSADQAGPSYMKERPRDPLIKVVRADQFGSWEFSLHHTANR